MLYRHAAGLVELAPAYDVVSTLPYMPRDSLALEMDGSKAFPDRARLIKFVRLVTGKTEKAANNLLGQVHAGVQAALGHAAEYGRRHKAAARFIERLSSVLEAGLARLNG